MSYQYALVEVHRERFAEALALLPVHPDRIRTWQNGMWRPWYAALWAEAAVLAGTGDAEERLVAARWHTAENPIADVLVDRAAAMRSGAPFDGAAERLDGLGARYQAARTRVLAGGAEAARGAEELDDLGTAPLH